MYIRPDTGERQNSASIKWKLVRSFGAVIAALVAFQVLYFPARQSQRETDALRLKARSITSLLAQNTAAALDFGDVAAVQEGFKGTAGDPDLRYIIVLDKNNKR